MNNKSWKENNLLNPVQFIRSKLDLSKYANEIWNLIQLSYHNDCKSFRDFDNFKRNLKSAKVVIDNNQIIACATYREFSIGDDYLEYNYKMTSISCDQTKKGKEALVNIIKDDIEKMDSHFWVEASGPVEHYFKKLDGYPIPNMYAKELVDPKGELITKLYNDKVHYDRKVNIDSSIITKMIFGFKSEEFFYRVQSQMENYNQFRELINKMETLREGFGQDLYGICLNVINEFDIQFSERGLNEIFPDWHRLLKSAVDYLRIIYDKGLYERERTLDYLDTGEYLLNSFQVLKLNRL